MFLGIQRPLSLEGLPKQVYCLLWDTYKNNEQFKWSINVVRVRRAMTQLYFIIYDDTVRKTDSYVSQSSYKSVLTEIDRKINADILSIKMERFSASI